MTTFKIALLLQNGVDGVHPRSSFVGGDESLRLVAMHCRERYGGSPLGYSSLGRKYRCLWCGMALVVLHESPPVSPA
jgi:hypothetical protein